MQSEEGVQGVVMIKQGAATRSGGLRFGIVALSVSAVVAVGCVAAFLALSGATARHVSTTRRDLESLPLAAQGPVSAALGQDEPAYRVTARRAVNPAQHLRAGFSRGGVTIVSGKAELGMALSGYGYGNVLEPLGSARLRVSANRVAYSYEGLTAWYVNGPLGLEQGFTVAHAPAQSGVGPLTVSLALSGNVLPKLTEHGHGLTLAHGGHTVLRYAALQASDARGRVLPSWLVLERGRVALRMDTAGAHYPLRIDPLIQQGEKLTGAGEIASGRFGYGVALSADGDTALIGARYDTPNGDEAGGAWIFARSGSTWTQQGGKLNGTGHAGETLFDHIGEGEFGYSVALSAGGDTALIGAPRDNDYVGAAWVFTRSGSTWTQQGEKLTGTDEIGEGRFGTSVALSPDGGTALVGGPADAGGAGAAWVFMRSGSSWAQQGEKLVGGCTGSCANEGTGEIGEGMFGTSVALSEDGDIALIGGPADNSGAGAAWVFERSGGVWSQQGQKLTGSEGSNSEFGYSVGLSGNGNTAVIGGPEDDTATGAVWVFERSGGVWSQQGQKLTGGEEGNSQFGVLVALSADGDTALIGGPGDNDDAGAAWVFTRSGGVWSQQGEKLVGDCTSNCAHEGTGETGTGGFGVSVALSADGDTALIGAPGDDGGLFGKGAAWMFTRSGGVWSQQGEKLVGDCTSSCAHEGTGEIENAWFGYNVALSADGSTALIGGFRDNNWRGAAWMFTRSGSSWAQQGEKLVGDCTSGCANEGTGETGNGMFGTMVALSADGDTALIGAWNDDNVLAGNEHYSGKGAAWVFSRSGASWAQQGEKLVGDCTSSCADEGTGETGEGKFGTSVALSEDGDTAMVGGWDDDSGKGAAWVFSRSGASWAQQGEKLVGDCTSSCVHEGTGETGVGRFGVSVALSADGDTALIGGLDDNGTNGAAWLFTRSGGVWSQQGEKFTGAGEAGEGEFGTNVALSADGGTGMIGAWRDNGGRGAAWVFVDLPTAATGAATGVGESSATLNGTLGAGGSSTVYFQYGPTAAYGSSTAAQSVVASSSSSPLAAVIGELAPGTTYHFRLVVETPDGVIYGDDQMFTTEARRTTSTTEVITTVPITNSPAQPTSPLPSVPSAMPPRPTVQHARQSTTRWREGNRLARISRAETPIGTTFSFSLNEQASVTFSFTQRVSGRTAGGRCVAQTEENRRKPACKRNVTAGRLTFTGHSGTDTVVFQGRISHGERLAEPGRYTLVITATNSAGARSAPQLLSFTIVK
jgi:FG-GAP repeat